MPRLNFCLILVVLLSVASCTATRRTDIFFGMNIPGGGRVTQEEWKQFNDSIVSLQFPEGYTEFDATGKWMDTESKQTITEPTKVLTFIGRKDKQRESRLDTIIQYYTHRFKQQAVLRIDTKSRVRFVKGER